MFKKYLSLIISVVLLNIFISSCEWTKIEPITVMPENVSFSNDIIPIFNQSCNTSGCHNSGGIHPDLSETGAFNSLDGSDLIDLNTPENSVLYIRMTDTKNPMPVSGILPESATNKILLWIQEGADNN